MFVLMIDGAGHYPQAEFPDETAGAVLGVVHRTRGALGGAH
jgi:hypothetical protein